MNLSVLAIGLAVLGAQEPKMAPEFSALGSDGKTHTLKSLTAGEKTVVFYFIGNTCPINDDAVKYYKQIAANYKDSKKVSFVGVIDGDAGVFKEWKAQHDTKITVLYDPELTVIRAFEAIASPWVIVVNPKGQVQTTHQGYSAARLKDLNSLMAKAGGVAAGKLDTTGAPTTEAFG
jgi:peroxiredoxin